MLTDEERRAINSLIDGCAEDYWRLLEQDVQTLKTLLAREMEPDAGFTEGWLKGYRYGLSHLQHEQVVADMLRYVTEDDRANHKARLEAERLAWSSNE